MSITISESNPSESNDKFEISEKTDGGYSVLATCGDCVVSVINYADSISEENQVKTERHMETDEIFIPVKGTATIVVGEEQHRIIMEPGKIYNVKRGVWHSYLANPGSVVMVVEKKGTGEENSEYRFKR